MRTRKALLAIGACAVIGVGAAGCGDDNNDKTSSSAAKPSAPVQKFNKVTAEEHGNGGKVTGTPVTSWKPGEQVNGKDIEAFLIRDAKEKTGADVTAECPASITFSPGGEFHCKVVFPDGTTFDIQFTMLESGDLNIHIIQPPTPPAPSNATTDKLQGQSGKIPRPKSAGSLTAGETIDVSSVADIIEKEVKQGTGLDVNVECPATVDFANGATFYCKLFTSDGTAYDVKVMISA